MKMNIIFKISKTRASRQILTKIIIRFSVRARPLASWLISRLKKKEKRIIYAGYDAALASSSAPVHTPAEENGSRSARKTEKGYARCARHWKQ